VVGWCDKDEAKGEITSGIKAYQESAEKPHF
jgi:hypothetical protein